MSSLRQPWRLAALVAFGLALALPAGVGRAQATEFDLAFSLDARWNAYSGAVMLASLTPAETPPVPAPRLAEPFGAEVSALVKGGLQRKWAGVAKQLPHERKILARCRADATHCSPAARRFLAIIDKALTREGIIRIAEINRAINLDIRSVDDMAQYHAVDLWATPLMTFASNAGDCEDYAIAKYMALLELGFAEIDLRLLVVRLHANDESHAVAAVRTEGRWLILDNRMLDMRDDSDVAEFDLMFVISRDGVKRMIAPGASSRDSQQIASTAAVPPLHAAWSQWLAPVL